MRVFVALAVALFLAVPVRAFEGELQATLATTQGVAARVHARYAKTGDVRMDIQSIDESGKPLQATTIMPATGPSYYTISPAERIIVEMPYSALADTSKQVKGSGENANLEVRKLGKEVVSGVETRHVKILDPDNEAVIDLWLTDQYPADLWTRAFRGRNLGLELSDDERTKAMKKYGVEPGFSMKMRVDQKGGVPVVFVVQQVRRVPIPPSVFALPEGYKRVKGSAAAQP